MLISGTLVDLWYRPSSDDKSGAYMLWIRSGDGVRCVEDREFRPSFSVITEKNAALVEQAVAQHENICRTEIRPMYASIYSEVKTPVIRAFMIDERRADETMREIMMRTPSRISFAEANIRADLQWHYLRDIPPHSGVNVNVTDGIITSIERDGSVREPLKIMAVSPVFTPGPSRRRRLVSVSIYGDGIERYIERDEPCMLREFQEAVDEADPDLLAFFDADNEKLPMLGLRARANNMRLMLGRLGSGTILHEGTYTKSEVKHWRARQVRAPGRVIMDLWKDARTDADLKRTDLSLDAVYEAEFGDNVPCAEAEKIYRLAKERLPMFLSWCERCMMPLDSVCREKHGMMNASMVNYALIGSTIIPDEAEYPEGFKTPLVEDLKENGGLVITPEAGIHEDVAIVDFSSLFPRIFVKHNISPETINCRHEECMEHGEKVPFLGFHICKKRHGIYPQVFGKVLEERDRVKEKMRTIDSDSEEYRILDVLYKSLKMQLVSPYGYMQFHLNNFRTVDGNRAVPAFGRWYLLRARDMAEEAGFNVVYADTDSLFIQRRGSCKEEYRAFCDMVSEEFGMELKLEHICRWVLFLPERPGGKKGLKKKYFASVDGEVLVRGLEVRRQDRSRITKEVQEKVLEMLASARDEKEFRDVIPAAASYVRGQVSRIIDGRVTADDLVIIKKLSRRPEEYNAATHHCVAAETLADNGMDVRVGGKIEYIITGKNQAVPRSLVKKLPDYDVGSYVENTVRPVYALLREFGVKYEDLLPGPRQMKLECCFHICSQV
ncbi:DNA polymerase [Methanocella sp. CWC-04]|uniref:DNA polymerase n=1 Tax=Methanooceanicella nereidis TaxID=2052831 RepID=A0AAP2W7U6_9EURY|nr:DNA polymerase domain-containing protein [Methanocella sp. CWC-04]MCD1295589.1 DNA polymerase [Methanocella sp. CWC-04]